MKLVIVDRSKVATYERMRGLFVNDPTVMVVWDRRQESDRRQPHTLPRIPEKRVQERRHLLKSFGERGFIVVDVADDHPAFRQTPS